MRTCHSKSISDHKISNLPHLLIPGATFYPFIISAGGLMHSDTLDLWNRIHRKLPPGTASFASSVISIGFIKRRVKAVLAIEGPRSFEKAGDRPRTGDFYSGGTGIVGNRNTRGNSRHTGVTGREDGRRIVAGDTDLARLGGGMEWTASQEEIFVNDGLDFNLESSGPSGSTSVV